ncbi:MAG: DUF3566 domain-containing protein [Actinomycetota bacterium]|nr:DUF3566 domain-containing protein [Actinomycetota bacterium]
MASDDFDDPDESRPDASNGEPQNLRNSPVRKSVEAKSGEADQSLDEGLEVELGEDANSDPVGEPTALESSADLLARMSSEDVDDDDLDISPIFRRERPRLLKGRFGRMAPVPARNVDRSTASAPDPSTPMGGYRVRRVRRLVRHIEPWSVLKVCLVFYLCVWGLLVIATRMLWGAAEEAGTISKVESFIEELFALETFTFDSAQIFRIFVLGGLVLVVGGIGVTVVLVILFNLISDLTGGIRFTMVEEETAVRQRRLRRGDILLEASGGTDGQPSESGPGE